MSSKTSGVQHSMQGVFVFVLLGLFALMSTLMVLLGAQMYRNTVAQSTANNESRVLSAYVRSMTRAQDAADAVSVEPQEGGDALALREEIEGESYVTWLYCHDGNLCELFTEAAYALEPDAGTPICPASDLHAELKDGLLTVRLTDGKGNTQTVQTALRCAPAAPGDGLGNAPALEAMVEIP